MSRLYAVFGFLCGFLMIVVFLFNIQERPYVLLVGGITCVLLNFVTNILLHIYAELIETRKQLAQLHQDSTYFNSVKIGLLTPKEIPMMTLESTESKKTKKKVSRKKALTIIN